MPEVGLKSLRAWGREVGHGQELEVESSGLVGFRVSGSGAVRSISFGACRHRVCKVCVSGRRGDN